jgi:hypothetical protein
MYDAILFPKHSLRSITTFEEIPGITYRTLPIRHEDRSYIHDLAF